MAVIEAIETVYLEANAVSSITFASLGSYEHLQLRMTLRTSNTDATVALGEMRFGDSAGISTSGYSNHRMYGEVQTDSASASTGDDAAKFYPICSSASAVDTEEYSCHILDIFDYRSTTKNVAWSMTAGGDSGATGGYVAFQTGLWVKPTLSNPMTQFYIGNNNLMRGSEFTLYGITSS